MPDEKMLHTCGHNQHTLSSECLALNDFFLSGLCWQSNTLVPIMLKGTPSNGILSSLKETFLAGQRDLCHGNKESFYVYYDVNCNLE